MLQVLEIHKILYKSLVFTLLFVSCKAKALEIKNNSLKALAEYAAKSGNVVTMAPGVYKLTNYLTVDSLLVRNKRKEFPYIVFKGKDNVFNLEGVEIEVDTELRTALNPPIHSDEFVITGSNNIFNGLTIRCKGQGTSPGGTVLQVAGEENILENITLHVAGS